MAAKLHFRALCVLSALALLCARAEAAQCATAGASGSATISGTVNNYWPATASLGSGGTSVTLGAARFSGGAAIAPGDLVLIMQMQNATINTSNNSRYGDNVNGDPGSGWTALNSSGNFAYARATSAVPTTGGTLTITASTGVAFTASGQSRFQVIRVPQYINATLSGTPSRLMERRDRRRAGARRRRDALNVGRNDQRRRHGLSRRRRQDFIRRVGVEYRLSQLMPPTTPTLQRARA